MSGVPLVRGIEPADVERILAIQAGSPEAAQWTREDYVQVASGDMAGWVAVKDSAVIGFLVARRIASDIEILNLAVIEDSRRHGIGAALLRRSLDWAEEFRAENAILEVRESNLAALQFYERRGFMSVARRMGYYANPPDNAVLLNKILRPLRA